MSSTPRTVRVAIVGASGYTSSESIRLLLGHPHAELVALTSRKGEQPRVGELFPQFAKRCELRTEPLEVTPAGTSLAGRVDIALLCLPHVAAMESAPALLRDGIKVIDLSADYRLKNAETYRVWYGHEHLDPANLARAVYGLTEWKRKKVAEASLVANPGCYPTAVALALAPLLREKLIQPAGIVINAVSGITGAGRTPSVAHHFPERNETFEAYKIGSHRHQVEMDQTLTLLGGQPTGVLFVPHVAPMDRGILATIYADPAPGVDVNRLRNTYEAVYGHEPFVRLTANPPATKNVAYSNFCDIHVTMAGGKVIVLSAIDNMVKGAAGQAIQNMNVMFGLPETAGLL